MKAGANFSTGDRFAQQELDNLIERASFSSGDEALGDGLESHAGAARIKDGGAQAAMFADASVTADKVGVINDARVFASDVLETQAFSSNRRAWQSAITRPAEVELPLNTFVSLPGTQITISGLATPDAPACFMTAVPLWFQAQWMNFGLAVLKNGAFHAWMRWRVGGDDNTMTRESACYVKMACGTVSNGDVISLGIYRRWGKGDGSTYASHMYVEFSGSPYSPSYFVVLVL